MKKIKLITFLIILFGILSCGRKERENTPDGGNKLIVYSLDGKPEKRFDLDRYIMGFDIDTKRKQIVAIDANSDNPFCVFKL